MIFSSMFNSPISCQCTCFPAKIARGFRRVPVHGPKRELAALALARPRVHCSREDQSIRIQNPRRFAFSILVTGANYQQIADVLRWNDIIPPYVTSSYEVQKSVVTILLRNARLAVDCQLGPCHSFLNSE
jgi:hypothetical protein